MANNPLIGRAVFVESDGTTTGLPLLEFEEMLDEQACELKLTDDLPLHIDTSIPMPASSVVDIADYRYLLLDLLDRRHSAESFVMPDGPPVKCGAELKFCIVFLNVDKAVGWDSESSASEKSTDDEYDSDDFIS